MDLCPSPLTRVLHLKLFLTLILILSKQQKQLEENFYITPTIETASPLVSLPLFCLFSYVSVHGLPIPYVKTPPLDPISSST